MFLFILLFFIFIAVMIAWGIAFLMTHLLKVRVKFKEIVSITMFFLLCFSISSILLWGREEGVTMYRLGHARGYDGAFLFFGFPVRWYSMFEPYDPSARDLFLSPISFYFDGFFIDFVLWLVLSVILVCLMKRACVNVNVFRLS